MGSSFKNNCLIHTFDVNKKCMSYKKVLLLAYILPKKLSLTAR